MEELHDLLAGVPFIQKAPETYGEPTSVSYQLVQDLRAQIIEEYRAKVLNFYQRNVIMEQLAFIEELIRVPGLAKEITLKREKPNKRLRNV